MELINYLNEYFLTKDELLIASGVSEKELCDYQEKGVMPKCSYKLTLNVSSDSFFGLHNETFDIEYYAKGYASWLGIIQSLETKEKIYAVFSNRYTNAIELLKKQGHHSSDTKINSGIDHHIEEEWGHFLNGIYGLCTKSGLPEDIAAKELSIIEINELSGYDELNVAELENLARAVNLLDSVSSLFPPHERLKSSRYRLVNEIRRRYKLQS